MTCRSVVPPSFSFQANTPSAFAIAKDFWCNPNGKELVIVTKRDLFFMDILTGKLLKKIAMTDCLDARSVSLSPDGKRVAFSYELDDHHLVIMSTESGKEISRVRCEPAPQNLKFSPDNQRLAFRLPGSSVLMWNCVESALEEFCGRKAIGVEFSSDGKAMIFYTFDKVFFVDATKEDCDPIIEEYGIGDFTCSLDARLVARHVTRATMQSPATTAIWKIGSWASGPLSNINVDFYNSTCAFSQDGKFFIQSDKCETLRLFETNTGKLLKLWKNKKYCDVCSFTFSPDNKKVLVDFMEAHMVIIDLEDKIKPQFLQKSHETISRQKEKIWFTEKGCLFLSFVNKGSFHLQSWDFWKPVRQTRQTLLTLTKSVHLSSQTILTIFRKIMAKKNQIVFVCDEELLKFIDTCKKAHKRLV